MKIGQGLEIILLIVKWLCQLFKAFKPLLDGLSDTLSSDTVMKLDDTSTKNIAAEIEDSQIERVRAIKKLKSLEAGLQTLNRFSRSKHAD